MAKQAKKTDEVDVIDIMEITSGEVSFGIIGTMPLIFNRMSEKAKRDLLMPPGRLTDAEKAARLKHDPVKEYRDSVYRNYGDASATRLCLPAPAFKGAMMTAALRLPGTTKTAIGQLTWVPGETVDVYGIPKLFMGVVRSADLKGTPDIRTRAIVQRWCCMVSVRFVQPNLTQRAIVNLMAGAGIISGVGDFRQEKGKGNYGQFRLVDLDDPEYLEIVKSAGRKVQDRALEHVECYNGESAELLEWHSAEVLRKGRERQTTSVTRGRKRQNGGDTAGVEATA